MYMAILFFVLKKKPNIFMLFFYRSEIKLWYSRYYVNITLYLSPMKALQLAIAETHTKQRPGSVKKFFKCNHLNKLSISLIFRRILYCSFQCCLRTNLFAPSSFTRLEIIFRKSRRQQLKWELLIFYSTRFLSSLHDICQQQLMRT